MKKRPDDRKRFRIDPDVFEVLDRVRIYRNTKPSARVTISDVVFDAVEFHFAPERNTNDPTFYFWSEKMLENRLPGEDNRVSVRLDPVLDRCLAQERAEVSVRTGSLLTEKEQLRRILEEYVRGLPKKILSGTPFGF